jgi:ankyrin
MSELGSNPDHRENEILWQAIEKNDIATAQKILDHNDITEHHLYDPTGQTMIHKAAAQGHSEILMLLLERTGAKPDLVNAQLASPLHISCKHNRVDIAKFLIGCGVDVNCQDEHGQTPLLLCCIHGNPQIASNLIEASISGHLTEPLEVDIADHRGLTPLNCAAIKGDHDMVRSLLSRGNANPNQASPKGCTPLMYAGRGGYSDCVRLLLEKKASALK